MSRDFIQERLAQLPRCGSTLVTRSYTSEGLVRIAVESVRFGDGTWTRCYLWVEDRHAHSGFDPSQDEFAHYPCDLMTNEAATRFYNELLRSAS